jgi:hypothetical protein
MASNQPAPPPPLITAQELIATEYPPLQWAVPDLIPEGVTIFAGRPKTGKSWLSMGLALAVASGSIALGAIHVQAGDVLYLALEDGSRRLKKRLSGILDASQAKPPARLTFATTWRRYADGGLDHIREWLQHHSEARLVIIDTLAKVRDRQNASRGIYEQDYAAIADLKSIADQHACGVLVVHHTNKGEASQDDPLVAVSGTLGLTGAADAVLVLQRPRNSCEGKLFITGRDMDERSIPCRFDPQYLAWHLDEEPRDGLSPERRAIVDALHKAGKPLAPIDVTRLIRRNHGAVKMLMQRMYEEGFLGRRNGLYFDVSQNRPEEPPPETDQL